MNVYRPEERRLVLRLMAYWDDLRGERRFPRAAEIDSAAIGDDWENCFVLVLRTPLDVSTFDHVGAALLDGEATADGGLTLGGVAERTLLRPSVGYLQRMLEKQVPISLGGEAELADGPSLYRSILLPLSEDGRMIGHVLGAANARSVAAEGPSLEARAGTEGAAQ